MIKIGNKTIDADLEVILEELKSFILVRDNRTVLKDIKSTSDNVMVTCPYHKGGDERRPSCGISTVDKPDHPAGTVHCFTCGKTASLDQFISYILGFIDSGSEGRKWLLEHFDVTNNRKINGELKNYKVECHNIYDEINIYVGCCINVSDNTQLKKYYEMEVNIAKNASKAKTDFLSRVSHDIRTPINSISGMNEMILRECKDKKIMEYAYQISESAEMLINLVNNVLDFTKIESGKMTLVNREYDTRKMLEGIIDIISIQAGKKKIDFVYNISSDLPAKLYGDDVRISQIIMNLLSNAIKYTSEGSVTLTVKKVHDGEESAEIFVSVKDTGMGIKKEDLSKLFNAFERFEEVKNHSIQGSGLGLNIVSYFLQMMNSNLEVDSEYGKGSDFSFVITQTIVDETPIKTFDNKVQNNEDYEYHALFTAPDAKILVVDDNEINRFVFVSLLSATKVQVDEAESGIKCLEMTKKEKYHMIFMDHMMPEMDGIETFHKIKEDENNLCRDIPIVALTANAIEGARQMYLDEGFNAYLAKPFDPEEVETLIRDSLPKELIL